MKKLKSVSIGIPAHNEAQNILNILRDISSQAAYTYTLERVFVVCDGCTDNTSQLVNDFSKQFKKIKLIDDKKRLGKSARLNQLFSLSKSDIHITFDADVKLANKFVLEEVVKKFENPNVGLVGGVNLPLQPTTFFESVVVTWIEIWNEVRRDLNNGITVHNHLGCVSAMCKTIYKKIYIPESMASDDDFIYFYVLKSGYKFAHAKKAKVYFRSASNMKDFFIQHSRFLSVKLSVAEYFGDWVNEYYKIPMNKKITSLTKVFLRKPFMTILTTNLQITLLLFNKVSAHSYRSSKWKIATSSKLI